MRRTIRGGVLLNLPSTRNLPEITDLYPTARIGVPLADGSPCVTDGQAVTVGQTLAVRTGLPILSPISGTVRLRADANTLFVENDGKYTEMGDPIPETALSLDALTPADLIRAVRQAGIPDGEGRPLWQKLERAAAKGVYLAAVPAFDDQPGGGLSSVLAALRADDLICALKLILVVFSAGQGQIVLSFSDRAGRAAIRQAVGDFASRIRIQQVIPAYPARSERPLFSLLTGKELNFRKRPEEAGVLILTPSELLAVADLFFAGRRYTHTYLSVDGEGVRAPLLLRVPVGTRIDELPEIENRLRHTRVVENGLMSGREIRSDSFVSPSTHALSVIRSKRSGQTERCIGCDACFAACPMYLSPRMILSADRRDDSPLAGLLADNPVTGSGDLRRMAACCIGCGCCSYVCPSKIPLTEGMTRLKAEIRPEEPTIAENSDSQEANGQSAAPPIAPRPSAPGSSNPSDDSPHSSHKVLDIPIPENGISPETAAPEPDAPAVDGQPDDSRESDREEVTEP